MTFIFALAAMLALILDSQTAILGASEAVTLCIRTAIPSLFPFFVLSGLIVPYAAKVRIPWLGKLLGIPSGWESVFLLGTVSGYPVGAQCVAQGFRSGRLDKRQAERMLGFCTNCGPSFLFGIVGAAFSDLWMPFVILAIGILSAAMVGVVWPHVSVQSNSTPSVENITLPQAVQQAIRSMASVCAWIILGKVLLSFLSKWLLRWLPAEISILAGGVLELTNGCLSLPSCPDEGLRFLIACGIVPFGGLCVAMQVMAICGTGLSCRNYLPQKALQGCISVIFALIWLRLPGHPILRLALVIGICTMIFIFPMEIRRAMVYNSPSEGGIQYAVPQKNRPILPILRLRHQAGQRTDAV